MISDLPLFIFTSFAGVAAGSYVADFIFSFSKERKTTWVYRLVCLIMLAIGLIGVMFHLGRPMMFLNALANPAAGITEEAYFSIGFGLFLLIDLILMAVRKKSPKVLQGIAAVLALGLVIVMSISYIDNYGTPAWTNWATIPMFIVGDLFAGIAVYAIFIKKPYGFKPLLWSFVVAAVLFLITLIFEAIHFNEVGYDIVLFIISMVVASVASCVFAFIARKREGIVWPVIVLVCAFVGVCIARWGFYLASVI